MAVQSGFQQFDVFIERAKKGFYPASNLYGASHGRFGGPGCKLLPTDAVETSALTGGHLKAYLKGA
jgi:hypothetical protein